jgi:hypothetical protein
MYGQFCRSFHGLLIRSEEIGWNILYTSTRSSISARFLIYRAHAFCLLPPVFYFSLSVWKNTLFSSTTMGKSGKQKGQTSSHLNCSGKRWWHPEVG